MLDQISPISLSLIAGVFGLIIGSFISMLSWRLPRMMHLSTEAQFKEISLSRSKCPNCQTPLTWYQLFPLFSWLLSKGKCRHCQQKISARYPLIEITTGLLTAMVVYHLGLNMTGYSALLFVWFLITISIIDLEHQLILDNLSLPLLWIGLIFSTLEIWTTSENAIFGAVAGYLILWALFYSFKLLTGKEGMGFGDFKLLAALGAWFGWMAIPQIILIASIGSIIIGFSLAIARIRSLEDPIPFGPFLALGGISVLFFGSDLIQKIL